MVSRSPVSLRAWLVVALLCVVGCLNYLDRNMITTMRKSIVEAVPMTDAQFGLLTSVFLWVYGLLSPFAGFLADRFSRSRVIIGSLLVWSAVTWLTAHATTLSGLLTARALMGVSEACYLPASLALIADYHRGHTRSRATSIHIMGIMVGAGLGGIGGWFADRHTWAFPFRLFGVIGVIYALVLAFVLRDPPEGKEAVSREATTPGDTVSFSDAIRSLLGNRTFLVVLAAWSLIGIAGWVFVGWVPTYFQERFHLTQGTAGFSATGYLSGAAFVGALLSGIVTDRWNRTNPRARILVPALGLCIAAPGVLLMANAPILAVAIAGLSLYGATRNFVDTNLMPLLCLIADPRYRATGYGVLNFCANVIGGIGIYAGGALRDAHIGLGKLFVFVFGCVVVAALLFFTIKPKQPVAAGAA